MFALAPLFVILLLAWVERGAPRPRVLAPLAAAAAALLVLAIPFDRFVTTSAVSDTLMLLPWWAIQLTRAHHAGSNGSRSSARWRSLPPSSSCRGASRSCCRSIVLVYWVVASKPDLVRAVSVRRPAGGSRRALPGHPGRRAGLDRPGRARRRRRGGPLDRAQRSFHREPERVLQPQRRPGLLHGRADAWRHRGAAGLRRAAHRRRPARGRPPGATPATS